MIMNSSELSRRIENETWAAKRLRDHVKYLKGIQDLDASELAALIDQLELKAKEIDVRVNKFRLELLIGELT